MKTNTHFAKLVEGKIEFAQTPLRVVVHHREEEDVPVVDPETGEPTGETEHVVREWDEVRTEIRPSAEDFAIMGFLPVVETPPAEDPPEGKHWHWTYGEWEERDGAIRRVWELEDDPPPPPRRWTRLSIKCALADAHLLPAAQSYLTELLIKPDYPAWAALSDCDYIEEGFGGAEAWNALLEGAATALGKTREEIDAFLANIPTEG